ncbi:hypothetical protein [Kribbella sp. NPDC004536]|uniref:hypothetical protein n=1 Tax=Kribbella sp. NPDC004536 TaxID=3364106 RepID=UPI0036C82AD9
MSDMERLVADLVWVRSLIANSPQLAKMNYTLIERDGTITVEVRGSHFEARAWRAAINGRICPSHVDVHGVRRQLVVGWHVQVQVVEPPAAVDVA